MTAKELLDEALKAVEEIDEPEWKALALSKIAQVLAKVDKAKAISLLDDALHFVRQIRDQSWQLSVLLTVIGAFTDVDAKQVPQIVMDLPSETLQILALSDAAEKLAQKERQTALKFLSEAERIAMAIEDEDSRDEALNAVAEAFALFDIEHALKIAQTIKSLPSKAATLIGIVSVSPDLGKQQAERMLEEGTKIAKQIKDPEERAMVLDELIEVLSKIDFQQAIALTDLFAFPERKAVALSVIAQSLTGDNPVKARELLNEAAQLARKVRDPDRQASAWRSICATMALLDIEQALNWARQIHDRDWRNWTLGDIAAIVANSSCDEAIKIAQEIDDLEERSSTLADIAFALASSDFEGALKIAHKIPDAFYRVQALAELARTLPKFERDFPSESKNSLQQ